ncbi:trimeric LpxA-like protein [Wallemia mellicola CBS 633.66]|uniref:Dynactin subunit 5 n=1 Tax=Wallemia mellicola (strain ATCC MYA-4683 / CBS 633.66) TaxID=671144 RepID=I4Y7D5_WALMC|nr:trimeric LpxA-like protein [Wallemia mellicola CBS 633.66]EIM19877.1 trimeric LpxA-like protein [Wallemia mellicola CBS 633.66]|eukprot:XP_006960019.1 trimeric LpxA-like protein [Wallemia mellicola CBS 633.66]
MSRFKNDSLWIETDTGNRISKKAVICAPVNIILSGNVIIKPEVIIRGDLRRTGPSPSVAISIGKFTILDDGCIIRPAYKTYKGTFSYYPMKIGDFTTIGSQTILEAAQVGSYVEIGRNCVIGRFVVIKDCAKVAPNSVIPPNTVIPPYALFSGNPAVQIDTLPESTLDNVELSTTTSYNEFKMT